tara:strand:+ start:2438 stop:6598 length:4161 start_codon:yes stop_codon:yes gene_type:complete
MDKFDFDVNNIISIQPKKRRQENILNNMNSVAKSSFMVNKNRESGITTSTSQTVKQSLLGQLVSDISVASGAEINLDVGMNPLKPEILGLLDLFRFGGTSTAEKTVEQFINYSFIYRKYREDLLKEILNKIYKADKKSDYIKLRRKFNRQMRITLDQFSFILKVITDKTALMNDLKGRISAIREDGDMMTLRTSKLMEALGLTPEDFKPGAGASGQAENIVNDELVGKPLWSNSMIFHKLLLEYKRTLLYTSPTWDPLQLTAPHKKSGWGWGRRAESGTQYSSGIGIDLDDGEFNGNYIKWLEKLGDDSELHIFARSNQPGGRNLSESFPLIDEIWKGPDGLVGNNLYRFRLYATLCIQELSTSKAIRRHIKKTDRSKSVEMVRDDINDMFSTMEQNPIALMPGIEIDGQEASLSVLEFSESNTVAEEKSFNYDEMLLHIIMNNDKETNDLIIKNIRNFRNNFRHYSKNVRTIASNQWRMYNAYVKSLSHIVDSHFRFAQGAANANSGLVSKLREVSGNLTKIHEFEVANTSTGTANSNPMGAARGSQSRSYDDQTAPGGDQPPTVSDIPLAAAVADTVGGIEAIKQILTDNVEMIVLMNALSVNEELQKDFAQLALVYTGDFKVTINKLNLGGEVAGDDSGMKSGLLTTMLGGQANRDPSIMTPSGLRANNARWVGQARFGAVEEGMATSELPPLRSGFMSNDDLKLSRLRCFIMNLAHRLFKFPLRQNNEFFKAYNAMVDGGAAEQMPSGTSNIIKFSIKGRKWKALGDIEFDGLEVIEKIIEKLTSRGGLLEVIAKAWKEFSLKGGGKTRWHPYKLSEKTFSYQDTNFSGIDRCGMFYIWINSFLRQLSEINGFSYSHGDVGRPPDFYVDLTDRQFKIGRMILREPLRSRLDFQLTMDPIKTQCKDTYRAMRNFIYEVCNKSINGFIRRRKTFTKFDRSLASLKDDYEIDITDILSRGGIEQLTTMNILLGRYKRYKYRKIQNYDNFITDNEKKAMAKMLGSGEPSFTYGLQTPSLTDPAIDTIEELEKNSVPAGDPAVEPDPDAQIGQSNGWSRRWSWFSTPPYDPPAIKSNKILAVGIPMGLRAELNKLIAGKTGIVSIYDPTFSRVVLEIWAKNVTESDSYRPIKVIKFNLDYFTNRSSRDVFYKKDFTIDDFKVFDKNDPYFRSQKIHQDNDEDEDVPSPEETAVREYKLNEVTSHLLKIYTKLLYGMNFDESQFFVDRKLLEVDYSDSENPNAAYQNELRAKFNSIITNITSGGNKVKTGFETTPADISRVIAESGNSRIKQFSNKLENLTDSKALEGILTEKEKKIKIDLEDKAIKIAQTFNYSAEISGGLGFFKRALAPKLFEKIILIDVPVNVNQSVTDMYVKIKMSREDEVYES